MVQVVASKYANGVSILFLSQREDLVLLRGTCPELMVLQGRAAHQCSSGVFLVLPLSALHLLTRCGGTWDLHLEQGPDHAVFWRDTETNHFPVPPLPRMAATSHHGEAC